MPDVPRMFWNTGHSSVYPVPFPAPPPPANPIDRGKLFLATRYNAVMSGAGQIWASVDRDTDPSSAAARTSNCLVWLQTGNETGLP